MHSTFNLVQKTLLLSSFIFSSYFILSQNNHKHIHENIDSASFETVKKKIKELKIEFFNLELEMSEKEAEMFWPIYDSYSNEIGELHKKNYKLLEKEEKLHEIRLKYNSQFSAFLGEKRTEAIYRAEHEFMRIVYEKALDHKRGLHDGHRH